MVTILIEAALRGEEIVIAKDDQPVVKLTPVSPVKRRRQPGSAKGLVTISDDFDEPLEDFKDYM
ncbi:type II toxin-antitoxin system Phd/YefM family antitoxin [Funiculus sociatus]|uniref:type II toxin-antitoxin system Phd/YefM family antitoxin n=1 Tax=Funiculus sociatus TaxID=450527 RepID=UPI00329A7A07